MLNLATAKKEIAKIDLSVSPEVAGYLQNQKRSAIAALEANSDKVIVINADTSFVGENYDMSCCNERGSNVKF